MNTNSCRVLVKPSLDGKPIFERIFELPENGDFDSRSIIRACRIMFGSHSLIIFECYG